MVKEVATGVFVSGGIGGLGYGIYNTVSVKNLSDKLINEVDSDGYGIPLDRYGKSDPWWDKAFHRYFLEITSTTDDQIDGAGSDTDRTNGDDSKQGKFIEGCLTLLQTPIGEDSDSKKHDKAKKWCVTYKTVKEQLTGNKNLVEKTDEKWKSKYDTAVATSGGSSFKTTIEKFKTKVSGSDDDSKKKEAIHKWCSMALDAASNSVKTQVTTHCELKQ